MAAVTICSDFGAQKNKIMVSGFITSWQKGGEKVKTVAIFTFLGSKTTVDSDHSHKIKGCFLLGGKAMINLDSILKSRGITLPTKVHLGEGNGTPLQYSCLENPGQGKHYEDKSQQIKSLGLYISM